MPFPALVSYASAVLHIEKPRASCGAIALRQSRQKLAAHERKNKPLNGLPESAHHLTRSGFRTRRGAASPDHLQKPGAPLCRALSSRRLTACSRRVDPGSFSFVRLRRWVPPYRLRGVELSIPLFDTAGPLVPGNRGADVVRASPLACGGDFLLRLAGCQGTDLIGEARRAALAASWFRRRTARAPACSRLSSRICCRHRRPD